MNTLARAESWGAVWGALFAQSTASWPELAQARAEWRSRSGSIEAKGPAFQVFAHAALVCAADELASKARAGRALGEQERADLARSVRETLALARSARLALARAEAARSALRSATRYGFRGLAREAAQILALECSALALVS